MGGGYSQDPWFDDDEDPPAAGPREEELHLIKEQLRYIKIKRFREAAKLVIFSDLSSPFPSYSEG